MNTEEKEIMEKIDRFLKDKVHYIVTDRDDPRVGVYAREDVKSFILNKIRTAVAERELEILNKLKQIEGEKWEDADHCSCLRYAIDNIENPDADRVFRPSGQALKSREEEA